MKSHIYELKRNKHLFSKKSFIYVYILKYYIASAQCADTLEDSHSHCLLRRYYFSLRQMIQWQIISSTDRLFTYSYLKPYYEYFALIHVK